MTKCNINNMKNLYLIGGGGHCKSCIDVIELENKFNIKGIFDIKDKIGDSVSGYKIIGDDNDIQKFHSKSNYFIITLGQIDRVDLRKKYFNMNLNFVKIISPRAYVSKNAEINQGTIIMHDAIINSGAIVGKNSIINTKSLVEHDAIIGDHCHISTGAIINGGVVVEAESFVGSSAVTKQSIVIKKKSFIKANTLVK